LILRVPNVRLELNHNLGPCAGAVVATFKIGNETIKLQLHVLPNCLLELYSKRSGIGAVAISAEYIPGVLSDQPTPEPDCGDDYPKTPGSQ